MEPGSPVIRALAYGCSDHDSMGLRLGYCEGLRRLRFTVARSRLLASFWCLLPQQSHRGLSSRVSRSMWWVSLSLSYR